MWVRCKSRTHSFYLFKLNQMKSSKEKTKILTFEEFVASPKKDRLYRLKGNAMPLVFMLNSKHSKNNPLLYFDEAKGINRAMRYCRNQRSVFIDEQDANFIMEHVEFYNGELEVKKDNLILQYFLYLHPGNGKLFFENDLEAKAKEDLKRMDIEEDAIVQARTLNITTAEAVLRIFGKSRVDEMTSEEIRHDIRIFARQRPEEFLTAIDDPKLNQLNAITKMIKQGIITVRNGKDVHYNLEQNKKKILTVPLGETVEDSMHRYFLTDEGIEAYSILQTFIE